MNDIKRIHRDAMELLDRADAALRAGNIRDAQNLRLEAYKTELEAARIAAPLLDLEPTRSVLHRSAASLAVMVGDAEGARKLLHTALAGNPPTQISAELEAMLDNIGFQRHLGLKGIELTQDELQLTISGQGIGYGIAPIDAVVSRIDNARLLLTRTAERILHRPYRSAGRQAREVADLITPMVSVPRAASFAVTLRLGRLQQTAFPGFGKTEQIVDELLECLELFTDQNEPALIKRIPEPDYYRNFLALSTQISPDGDVVNMVGFTASRDGNPREVAIRKDRSVVEQMLLHAPRDSSVKLLSRPAIMREVTGLLRFADALSGAHSVIKLKSEKKTYNVIVPSGIDDIVRPYWGKWVTITGQGQGRNIELRSIRAAESPGGSEVDDQS